MSSLRERAQEILKGSPVMQGREKMQMADLINQSCHISMIDMLNDENGEPFVVFTTTEHPDMYTFGGLITTDLFVKLMPDEDNGIDILNKELEADPLEVKFSQRLSKDKKRYTVIEVV